MFTQAFSGLMGAIGDGVTAVISYAGDVATALFTESGELASLLCVIGLSVGLGIVGWGIRTVKSLTWGF